MLIKKFQDQKEIIAGDDCILRELLNPSSSALADYAGQVPRGDKVECRYSIAWAKVPVGKTTFKHAMKTTEVYVITSGRGKMFIKDEVEEVGKYDTIYIPPNAIQCIENIGGEELEFICIVDPAWRPEDEVIGAGLDLPVH